jgi:cell division septation protein DedD
MTNGPFLYDEGPEPIHTGAPLRRQGLLLWIFGGTVLVAVLMVVLLPLVKGSGEDQSREVVQVFLTALDKGDNETAYQLLCEEERAELSPEGVAGRYLAGDGAGTVASVSEAQVDGDPAQRVRVDWPGAPSSEITVVNADGPHVCGVTPQR